MWTRSSDNGTLQSMGVKREPKPGTHFGKPPHFDLATLDALERLRKAIRHRDRMSIEQNLRENRLSPSRIDEYIIKRRAAEQGLLRSRADLDELLREDG